MDRDYWYAMQEAYQVPRKLLKQAFEAWSADTESPRRFGDYMEQMLGEA